ncbi:MAG: regulatory protein GemA [Proteobacteria bacterium]|nr:regulatory protein GemA [Pseudomonadota bacterium]MBU1546720.1 regulatory protein GemA [Pseudomonadota bacterium]MBU2618525.1 regulatory protein GemA [Pseudomonadota bacterium]
MPTLPGSAWPEAGRKIEEKEQDGVLDRKKLAVIHIVKKELGASDQEYRDTLEKVAGVRSARDLDDAGFQRLMRYFARSGHYRASREGITFRQRMYIKHLVDDLAWDANHYANFLKKYYKTGETETLSKTEAGKVIESLKHILAGRRKLEGEGQQ